MRSSMPDMPFGGTRPMEHDLTIRTSEKGWLERLAIAYRKKIQVFLIDDAEVGIDPAAETLFGMGRKSGLSRGEWHKVLGCLGVSGFGLTLVFLAMIDPEPTSKLALLVGGGVVLVVGGGGASIYVLTGIKPPIIEVAGLGFNIRWGET
jgi:hypothetical protein